MADEERKGDPALPLHSKHRFCVAPQTDEHAADIRTRTAIDMDIGDMEALSLLDGDWVEIKARKKRATVCKVFKREGVPRGTALLNDTIRKNLNVRNTDFVNIHRVEPSPLASVKIAPIEDYVKNIQGDFLKVFAVPYFKSFQRVLHEGDLFMCTNNVDVWFKVLEIESSNPDDSFGLVLTAPTVTHPETRVEMVDPISKEEGEADLNRIGYEDVGGLREQLHQIREIVELPIRHPKLFTSIGVRPPKGVLMHGPPGTGKTLIAKAIASETGAEFKTVNGPEIMSGKQGGSEANIRSIFEEASKVRDPPTPYIIFIDEIDAIAPNRDKVPDEKLRRVVATLLTCMDGLKSGASVMVIGATNRPNSLDPALRRAGRFDTELVIPVPSREGRLEILQILTRKQKLNDDVDLKKLADATHGYVGADLSALCMKAAVRCIRKHAKGVLDMDEEDLDAEFLDSLSVRMEDFIAALEITQPSMLRSVQIEKPDISFDDIGGLDEVKQELREMIEMPVKHPELFEDMGIQPPKGALMYGPPGCGKTLLAKAMANECDSNFISIKGSQLNSSWFGESEENVREVFDKARQSAPCILFFDELDSIAQKRGGHGAVSAGGVADRVVNQLLTEMDGVGERADLFVIGATNLPHGLDRAILRPGRMDQLIYIPVPDAPARRAIFKANLRKTRVAKDIDIDRMADEMVNFTGADIAGLCQMAVKIAVRQRLTVMAEAERKHEDDPLYEVPALGDFEIPAEAFEIARANARSSVTPEKIAQYTTSRELLVRELGIGTTLTTEDAPGDGRFTVGGAGGGGGAGGAEVADGDDDDDIYG